MLGVTCGHMKAKPQTLPVLALFCVALRRKAYEELGALDEQFGTRTFDLDYTQRIRAVGLRVTS